MVAAVDYPLSLRTIIRGPKQRTAPANYRVNSPRKGWGYAESIGSDVPLFWDVAFRFTQAEAAVFRVWFRNSIAGGLSTFNLPIRTEFGLITYEVLFLPDSLLKLSENGEVFEYTATIMARSEIIPAEFVSPAVASLFAINLWTGDGGAARSFTAPGLSSGGVVWTKSRNVAQNADLYCSPNGSTIYRGGPTGPNPITATGDLTMSGTQFALTSSRNNVAATNYVGWSFGRSPRFCDVVTYTGDGASGRGISHSLGIAPGMVFVVDTTNTDGSWYLYERTGGAGVYYTATGAGAAADSVIWSNTTPTSTQFFIGASARTNTAGRAYMAILFAHDTAADGVIQCAAYTGNGSTTGPTVTLGWQPQFVIFRNMSGGGSNWACADTTRTAAFSGNDERAYPMANNIVDTGWTNALELTSDGFQLKTLSVDANGAGVRYLALCVRGP